MSELEAAGGSSLGSVLAEDPDEVAKPRGPDLHVVIEVPPTALGAAGGFAAPLPLRVPHAGERWERAALPGEESFLRLHLPRELPSGAVLRLRRQGGVCEGGVPGDLFARIVVRDTASPAWGAASGPTLRAVPWVAAAVLVLLGVVALTAFLH